MPNYKIDLLLKQGSQGASEIYYMTATSLEAVFTKLDTLIEKRRALMSSVSIVQGYRVMPLSASGLPTGKQHGYNKTALNWAGAPDRLRDEEDVALLVRCEDATEDHSKTTHLRFLPDNFMYYDALGNWVMDEPLLTPFNEYKAQLISGSYMIREFDANLNSNINASVVETVKFDEDGLMSVVLRDPIDNLQTGTKVKIKGYKGAFGKQVNGLTTVLGITTVTVGLDKQNCKYKNVQGPGAGAILFMESYQLYPITICRAEGPSSHDTGRAFFVRRGRRSKRPACLFTHAGEL